VAVQIYRFGKISSGADALLCRCVDEIRGAAFPSHRSGVSSHHPPRFHTHQRIIVVGDLQRQAAFTRTPLIYKPPLWETGSRPTSRSPSTNAVGSHWHTSCPLSANSWGHWKFWQDADNGSVPGSSGHVRHPTSSNGSLAVSQGLPAAAAPGTACLRPPSRPSPASLGGPRSRQIRRSARTRTGGSRSFAGRARASTC